MNPKIAKRLRALNLRFYTIFASSFAASRSVSDPALTCILPYIGKRARVLDIGCGHGRLALLLDRERSGSTYLGIDFIPELIRIARVRGKKLSNITADFYLADITRGGWDKRLKNRCFDCVVLLAVLHHIPDFNLRVRVLSDCANVLDDNGVLIVSSWQFFTNIRMKRKIIEWSRMGIDEKELESGDYLLDWKRGGFGLRYCHLVNKTELTRLAKKAGLSIRKTWRAGGREGNLSLYAVLEK